MLYAGVAVLGLSITSILGAQNVNETTDFLLSPDVQRYRAAVHLEPLNADLYVNRETIYVNQGLFPKALADFERGIELDPGGAPAYANKAFLYENLGRWDEALETHKALVRHARPGYPQIIEHAKSRIRDLEQH